MQETAEALKTIGRFVFFRSTREELESLGYRHLLMGLVFVWLAGVGRHWDDPKAELLQSLGVGSLMYVFFLAVSGIFMAGAWGIATARLELSASLDCSLPDGPTSLFIRDSD